MKRSYVLSKEQWEAAKWGYPARQREERMKRSVVLSEARWDRVLSVLEMRRLSTPNEAERVAIGELLEEMLPQIRRAKSGDQASLRFKNGSVIKGSGEDKGLRGLDE